MDIGAVASAVSNSKQAMIQAEVSVSAARQALDVQAQQGAALVRMMETAGGLGQNLNTQA